MLNDRYNKCMDIQPVTTTNHEKGYLVLILVLYIMFKWFFRIGTYKNSKC